MAAARRLGWETILCKVYDETVAPGLIRMMQISENLHRADLTVQQRAEQIEEWRRLAQVEWRSKLDPHGGAQPHERGVHRVTTELGVTRQEVQRAKIANLTPEAKATARELWRDDKQTVLLVATSANADPAKEVAQIALPLAVTLGLFSMI